MHLGFFREKFILFFIFFYIFLPSSSSAEILIIQSSDQHSEYREMMSFVASVEVLSRDFKMTYPHGKVVLLINGDYSSKSVWTEKDRGQLGYDVLSQLAEKYEVVFVFGNHEAFDWMDNQLFLKQMTQLKQAGAHLVTANISLTQGYKNLFTDFVDIFPEGQKKSIRFIGFTLSSFSNKSGWNSQLKPRIFSKFYWTADRLPVLVKKAHNDPLVSSVVLAFHEGASSITKYIKQIDNYLKTKISVAFLGHHHTIKNDRLNNIQMISSGDYFDFTAVTLNDKGQIIDNFFYDQEKRNYLLSQVNKKSLEFKLINETIRPIVRSIEYTRFQSNKFISFNFIAGREKFLKNRTILGTLLAEALRAWAFKEAPKTSYQSKTHVAVFLDSTLYQREQPIFEGTPINSQLINTFFSDKNYVKTLHVKGFEIETLYFSLLNHVKKYQQTYSPQLSLNLQEKQGQLFYLINKKWIPIRKARSSFLLVLDDLLVKNTYQIPEWNEILLNKHKTSNKKILNILQDYFLQTIGNKSLTRKAKNVIKPVNDKIEQEVPSKTATKNLCKKLF